MDTKRRAKLEAAGLTVHDSPQAMLELSDAEMAMIKLRYALGKLVAAQRDATGMSQGQLAEAMDSTQSRVSELERGAPKVSLDLYPRASLAMGLELPDFGIMMNKACTA